MHKTAFTFLMLSFFVAGCVNDGKNSSGLIIGSACGDSLGSFNGVAAYYNEGFNSCVPNRHMSADGYSYGIRWQCVEYVRRYYKIHLNHKMSSRYGNAADYFRDDIGHGDLNTDRNLKQFQNNNTEKPKTHDILVFKDLAPPYGHMCIVMEVNNSTVQVIEQNFGARCFRTLGLERNGDNWEISNGCTGFLRK